MQSTALQQLQLPDNGFGEATDDIMDVDILNANFQKLDKVTRIQCTSTTRPALALRFDGMVIWEADTNTELTWVDNDWVATPVFLTGGGANSFIPNAGNGRPVTFKPIVQDYVVIPPIDGAGGSFAAGYLTPFPNGVTSVQVTPASDASNLGLVVVYQGNLTAFSGKAYTPGGVALAVGLSIKIWVHAVGW